MSRKCLEQLNNKDVLEQFDSKINNGMSEKVASLEILNEQINNFKDKYISFVTNFKDSTSEIAKFKVIEDNINSQIQELLKPEDVATVAKSEVVENDSLFEDLPGTLDDIPPTSNC